MPSSSAFLTALPVFNEVRHVRSVLDEVRKYSPSVLAVDDGSTDGTSGLLREISGIQVAAHPHNLGYGAALRTAFQYAIQHNFQTLVTIDCDGQHQPKLIGQFVEVCRGADIVSGSRYLEQFAGDSLPPEQRRRVNVEIADELCRRLGLKLTDAFCGFKAYRVEALQKFDITETGYGMPLEVWVQAVAAGMKIVELPVPLIYLEEERSFGGSLDNAQTRRRYYQEVIDRSIAQAEEQGAVFSAAALCGENSP